MNTLEHLREQFVFNDWANRKLIAAVTENGSARGLKLLAHLLITEKEYFARLGGKDSTGFDFWPDLSFGECEELRRENTNYYLELIDRLDEDELEVTTRYKTSEGIGHENNYREMLTHVLFHSVTHRGQALAAVRADGFEPPKIDYIIFSREY
jgi:uncharacterized damage-inducible protein DinB